MTDLLDNPSPKLSKINNSMSKIKNAIVECLLLLPLLEIIF